MILQALNEYYGRLRADPESGVPEPGFSWQGISFALTPKPDGTATVIDLRDDGGRTSLQLVVPDIGEKKGSGIKSNFLWGNAGYMLGVDYKNKPDRVEKTFQAFKEMHVTLLSGVQDERLQGIVAFLENWDPEAANERIPNLDEMKTANLCFRLDGNVFAHDLPEAKEAWLTYRRTQPGKKLGLCLVTGEKKAIISKLHPPIKKAGGDQAETSLVSFNLDAFTSYGKEQNYNAPVSEDAAFAYTTALNHLLRREYGHKVQIGDTATVFWTERASPVEFFLGEALAPKSHRDEAEDGGDVQRVHDFLEALRRGRALPAEIEQDKNLKFYILGLAPNAARLSVRFWFTDTVRQILDTVGRHFAALEIVKQYPNQPEFPAAWMLLRETAAQGKDDNIPAPLTSGLMRSILIGAPYPQGLVNTLLMRVRADHDVNYLRAALIKACLIRNHNMEVTVALDRDRKDEAYRIGRLFAMLELAQAKAIGAGAGIRDRFYGAASATPLTVFPRLLQLYGHHLQKLRKGEHGGYAVIIDREVNDILSEVNDFPSHFNLLEQSLFALGYYHQCRNPFPKRETTESTELETAAVGAEEE